MQNYEQNATPTGPPLLDRDTNLLGGEVENARVEPPQGAEELFEPSLARTGAPTGLFELPGDREEALLLGGLREPDAGPVDGGTH